MGSALVPMVVETAEQMRLRLRTRRGVVAVSSVWVGLAVLFAGECGDGSWERSPERVEAGENVLDQMDTGRLEALGYIEDR
jgi:hypothetical protein